MAELEQEDSGRVPSAATGRHSHRRRARKRAGDSAGAFADGTLEQKATRWATMTIGIGLIIGQLVLMRVAMPENFLRTVLTIFGVALLALVIVWFDQQRSKKRNPRPRWLRGILIAGFLCFSVVLGSLVVLNMTANPIEDGSFTAAQGGEISSMSHFGAKTLQLKLLAFHILMAVSGMALIAVSLGSDKHRRNDSGRFKSAPSTPA